MNTSTEKVIPKRRGRPATGKDPLVAIRIAESATAKVDDWARAQSVTRSEAIRRLIELGLETARAQKEQAGD